MAVSEFVASTEIKCEVNGGKGDFLDLLGFPDEIIDGIFSFLKIEDRMRARVNKRLSKIEAESKYYLNDVFLNQYCGPKGVNIEDRWYPFDFINRIAHNISIGELEIRICPSDSSDSSDSDSSDSDSSDSSDSDSSDSSDSDSFDRTSNFLDLIKKFRNIGKFELVFCQMTREQVNEIMIESFFLDLTRRCKTLSLECLGRVTEFSSISVETLHQVYKSMADGSTNFRKLYIDPAMYEEKLNAFLNFSGIAFVNKQIFSNRRIEAYKDMSPSGSFYVNIFDDFFHICFKNPDESGLYEEFSIELHENLESLNKAKNAPHKDRLKRARMNVYSE